VENAADGINPVPGTTNIVLAPAAMTGRMYPPSFYKQYTSSNPVIPASKLIHLDNVANF